MYALELLKVIKETENDDLTEVLQELIETYSDDIADVAIELCSTLVSVPVVTYMFFMLVLHVCVIYMYTGRIIVQYMYK